MPHFTKLIKIILSFVFLYSIYIYIKIPTLTEGFTNNIRETLRPTIRQFRLSMDDKLNRINTIKENFKMKKGL